MISNPCKMCQEVKPLVEAHIIPQSFYRFMKKGDSRPCRVYSSGDYPKRTLTGISDKKLVCEDCERVFAPYDGYGAEVLIPEFPDSMCIKDPNGTPRVYQRPAYDYVKLKLFLLSVLWRMSASRRPEFARISLGPHGVRIAEIIKSGRAILPDEYPVMLTRFTDVVGHNSILSPRRTRIVTGQTLNIFYLGGYMVRVKVDSRPMPAEVAPFLLRPDAPLNVVLGDSRNRREFAGIARLVIDAEQLRGKARRP